MASENRLRLVGRCLASVLASLFVCSCLLSQTTRQVLVYTRNYTPDGKGYVHENIAESVDAIRRIGAAHGFTVTASDDPAVFTTPTLNRFAAIVFANSNNEAFANDAQREAFRAYIHAGHGFIGLHSASGSERDNPYFQQVLGGHFAFHPPQQTFTVDVAEQGFAAVVGTPPHFSWTDECYFLDRLAPDIHPVLVTDRKKLTLGAKAGDAEAFQNPLPIAWYHTFDNSREFYLALGHNPADYKNPLLFGIIERGLLWTMQDKP